MVRSRQTRILPPTITTTTTTTSDDTELLTLCVQHGRRILFFPMGNNVEYASVYLEHAYEPAPPEDWYSCVQFALVLWNPNEPSNYVYHRTSQETEIPHTRLR
jgi:hypothetical protein